jgi:hypothetical protein
MQPLAHNSFGTAADAHRGQMTNQFRTGRLERITPRIDAESTCTHCGETIC